MSERPQLLYCQDILESGTAVDEKSGRKAA
jgi:hypothetical protein